MGDLDEVMGTALATETMRGVNQRTENWYLSVSNLAFQKRKPSKSKMLLKIMCVKITRKKSQLLDLKFIRNPDAHHTASVYVLPDPLLYPS